MDDSQPPGDIAHTSVLNDRKLLAPLSNYLYRFVSVHLLAVFGQAVSSPLWQKYSTEMQPRNSQIPFWKASNVFFPVVHVAVWRCHRKEGRKGRRKDWKTKGHRGLVNRKGQRLNIKSWVVKIIKGSSFSWNFLFYLLSFWGWCAPSATENMRIG